ncbi:MAG TPA: hypothetical protein ENN75_01920 [candidate division Zixibacteria bacterium]|nr:hypothetical protein [candidate division Zixibacteria bacterium]
MFWTKNKGGKKPGTTIIGLVYSGRAAIGTDFDVSKENCEEIGLVDRCTRALVGFTGDHRGSDLPKRFVHKLDTCEDIHNTCREISHEWQSDELFSEISGKLVALGRDYAYLITPGKADRIETGVIAVGPGEEYALAAIRAILAQPHVEESVEEIVKKAFNVAAGVCVLVNSNATIISLN